MPIIVAIDHEHRQVNVVAIGPVTLADALQQLEHESRGGGLGYPKFIDVRGAGVLITPDEEREVAARMRELNRKTPFGPMAFVVSSDETAGAIGLLAQLVKDVFPLRVFRDEKEAREWLAAHTKG